MADKEEKYFINKVWDETIIRGNKFTTFHNNYGVEFTRQHAIEKIARALCVADGVVDCDECIYRGTDNCKTQLKNWYLKDAEVALDALLGDK